MWHLPRSAVWLKQNCGFSLGGSGVLDITGPTAGLEGVDGSSGGAVDGDGDGG